MIMKTGPAAAFLAFVSTQLVPRYPHTTLLLRRAEGLGTGQVDEPLLAASRSQGSRNRKKRLRKDKFKGETSAGEDWHTEGYDPRAKGFEHVNIGSAGAWEVTTLCRHWHPEIAHASVSLLSSSSSSSSSSLSSAGISQDANVKSFGNTFHSKSSSSASGSFARAVSHLAQTSHDSGTQRAMGGAARRAASRGGARASVERCRRLLVRHTLPLEAEEEEKEMKGKGKRRRKEQGRGHDQGKEGQQGGIQKVERKRVRRFFNPPIQPPPANPLHAMLRRRQRTLEKLAEEEREEREEDGQDSQLEHQGKKKKGSRSQRRQKRERAQAFAQRPVFIPLGLGREREGEWERESGISPSSASEKAANVLRATEELGKLFSSVASNGGERFSL